MKLPHYFLGALVLLTSVAATSQTVPYTFQSGTPAQAAQVNSNFQSLNTRLNASIGALQRFGVTVYSDTGVVSASCPVDSMSVSANCNCDYVSGTRDSGVVFHCQVAGNGGVAGCFDYPDTYLPAARAVLTVACVRVVANDGTIPPVTPISDSGSGGGLQKTGNEIADELEAALKSVQDQRADHGASMKISQPHSTDVNP